MRPVPLSHPQSSSLVMRPLPLLHPQSSSSPTSPLPPLHPRSSSSTINPLPLPPFRLAEAAFFARTYLPSQISRVVGLWKASVGKKNAKAASAIADPTDYENLFPGLRQSFQAENYLR